MENGKNGNSKNGKKIVVDTALLLHYLTDDKPQKARVFDDYMDSAQSGEIKIFIPSIVIAELVWILESYYHQSADKISEIIEAILNTPGIDVSEKEVISSALRLYRTKNIDLVDAWVFGFAVEQ